MKSRRKPYRNSFKKILKKASFANRNCHKLPPSSLFQRPMDVYAQYKTIVTLTEIPFRMYILFLELTTLSIRDRKSTRLNSSHANISYAVFCLKKKKKKIHHALRNVPKQLKNKLHMQKPR